MSARLKGRRRQAELVIATARRWAVDQPDVLAVGLVGSYARNEPRMGSDVDLVLLTAAMDRHTHGVSWVRSVDPKARLIRDQWWGVLRERRVRLRSGLQVELGIAPPNWAALPLDAGTRRVLQDGCTILYDPSGLLRHALDAL